MSDAQIFQIFSVVYVVVGIGMIVNPAFYRKMFSDFIENGGVLYMGGIMALVVGVLLVIFHNTWTKDWSVIITIIGWMALIKGVVILILPKAMISLARSILQSNAFMKIEAVIAIVVGVLFAYLGFCPAGPILKITG